MLRIKLQHVTDSIGAGMGALLTVVGVIVLIGFGFVQIVATYAGVSHWLGNGWAWAAMALMLFIRHPVPLIAGAFYGAAYAWGWEWYWALLFAAPGLLLLVPGSLVGIWEAARR